MLGDEPMMGDVIAERHHEVGRKRVGRVDHAADVLDQHVGAAEEAGAETKEDGADEDGRQRWHAGRQSQLFRRACD